MLLLNVKCLPNLAVFFVKIDRLDIRFIAYLEKVSKFPNLMRENNSIVLFDHLKKYITGPELILDFRRRQVEGSRDFIPFEGFNLLSDDISNRNALSVF